LTGVLCARDLMTPDPVVLAPTDTLRFAAGVLTSIGTGGAPVMDGERVVGVISITDIVEFAADNPSAPGDPVSSARPHGEMAVPAGPGWDALDEHTVAEVMSLRILSVPPAAEVRALAELMDGEGVHRLLVMDEEVLVGIVTASDLVRAVARGDLIRAVTRDGS
jgi:CBS domain-containing protein